MSKIQPYSPLHEPQKHVTQEDMWQTLAKHAKPQVSLQVLTERQSPKEKSRLEWRDPVKTHATSGSAYIESVCGRFTVTKTPHELGWTYCAHDRITKTLEGGMATCLGCKSTKEAAIELCEATR